MRCDEIQEHLVDLLYNDGGTPVNAEIQDHLKTCPACRQELEELKQTRQYLHAWEDESPLRSITIARHEKLLNRKHGWKYVRYAAVAAMAVICILALANIEIAVNKNGFSFSTHLFAPKQVERDYYTKTEVRDIVKRALDDSEYRTNEITYMRMQKLLDTVEQDQWMDLRLIRGRAAQNRNRN